MNSRTRAQPQHTLPLRAGVAGPPGRWDPGLAPPLPTLLSQPTTLHAGTSPLLVAGLPSYTSPLLAAALPSYTVAAMKMCCYELHFVEITETGVEKNLGAFLKVHSHHLHRLHHLLV